MDARMKHLGLVVLVACSASKPSTPPSEFVGGAGAVAAAPRAWDLNDVSILMPLPKADELPRMLQTSSTGTQGALLPRAWLDSIPKPFVVNRPHDKSIEALRVVALRIDPCFKNTATSPCRHMVRMSWQPIMDNTAVDAALHTFYDLSPGDFAKLADELWRLREPYGKDIAGKPLDVHPVLKQQGFGGDYFKALSSTLLSYCGEKSLTRMTVMQLGGRTNVWIFTGLDTPKRTPIKIARIDATVQTIAVHAQPPTQFDGGLFKSTVDPSDFLEPSMQPELNKFLRGTSAFDRTLFPKVLDTIAFLETPAPDSTPETIDCASCHITQAARVWIGKHAPDAKPSRPAFANPGGFNLENISPLAGLTNQLRAFGFIQQQAVVSQRVINESATVAAAMRTGG